MCSWKENVRARHRDWIAIDVEDDGSGNFISAALYGTYKTHHGNSVKVDEYYTDLKMFQNRILELCKSEKNIGFNLVFFNAAYDLKYLEALIDDKTRIENKGKFITAKINKIAIYDIMNQWTGGLKLEDWIKMLDMEKKYGIKKYGLDELEKRNKADAKATWVLAKYIEDFYVKELNVSIKLTVGSTALQLYRKNFFKFPVWNRNTDFLNIFERKAYRGGRVECYKRGIINTNRYDVRSMYVSIMNEKLLPDPNSAHYVASDEMFWENWDKSLRMIIHCVVDVPTQYIPPLPYYDTIGKKLLFPIGTFESYWTDLELRNAEKYGARIIKVIDYIYYTEERPYFKEFAQFVWNKRKEYDDKGNKAMSLLIKTIGNSLYGKFGQSASNTGWFKFDSLNEDDDINVDIKKLRFSVDKDGICYVYIKGDKRDVYHCFPVIPVFITSYARIKLLEYMKQAGENNVVYCDTDSIHLKVPYELKTGDELGELKFEGTGEMEYIKPKVYGKHSKGIPSNAEKIYENVALRTYRFNRPVKRAESKRRNIEQNLWIEIIKEIKKQDDKRVWNEEGTDSFPINVGDLLTDC
jgi:hypothetical protein